MNHPIRPPRREAALRGATGAGVRRRRRRSEWLRSGAAAACAPPHAAATKAEDAREDACVARTGRLAGHRSFLLQLASTLIFLLTPMGGAALVSRPGGPPHWIRGRPVPSRAGRAVARCRRARSPGHQAAHLSAHLLHRLANARQGDRPSCARVVVSDDGDVFRDPSTCGAQAPDGTDRHQVRGSEHRIDVRPRPQQPLHLPLAARPLKSPMASRSGVTARPAPDRVAIAGEAIDPGRHVRGSGDRGDAPGDRLRSGAPPRPASPVDVVDVHVARPPPPLGGRRPRPGLRRSARCSGRGSSPCS